MQNVRSSRTPPTADDEYFSDASDSDSSASGASARAAQSGSPSASLPHEFQITFSDGDDDDEDDGNGDGDESQYVVTETDATNGQRSDARSQADNASTTLSTARTNAGSAVPSSSTVHEGTPNSEAWLKQLDQELNAQFGEASHESGPVSSAAGHEVLEQATDARPQPGPNPVAEDAAVAPTEASSSSSSSHQTSASRPESAQSGSASSPSSTTTVENSDGWDACATDADDGCGFFVVVIIFLCNVSCQR